MVRLTDFKTGKPANVAQRASSREGGHLARVAQGGLLQSVAYALAAGSASEGRYVYLGPDTPDHARRFPVRADDAAFVEAFHGALRVVLEGWDRGAFFPRLVGPDLELEPRTCTRCATKQACLRGDSGAKGRLVDWMRQRASGRRVGAAEEAVGDVFFLGREP